MLERRAKLKQRQRDFCLKAKDISDACKGGKIKPSVDTVRQLGQPRYPMSPEMLDAIEAGIEKAIRTKQSFYSLVQEAV